MFRSNRFMLLIGLLLIASMALVACAAPPPPAAAPAAGAVAGEVAASTELNVLCTPQVAWCEGMKAEFEKANPTITVNFVRMSSGESLTRLRNEKDNPQFDIWWGGPVDSFVAAKNEGLMEQYNSPNMANIKDQTLMKDADNYWAGVYVGSLGFITNQNFLDANPGLEPPRSWDDLLKPEFTGQLMVAHPSSSGTSYTALCTVLQMRGEEAGWEYLRQYSAQVLQFTKSGSAPAKFIGQGEAAVGIVFSHDIVAEQLRGSPVVLSFPEEGTGYEIGGMGIIKGAKHLDAAKLWFDWALEPATQELGPKYEAYQAPTVNGAAASMPELLDVNLINYDFQYCGDNKKDFVDRFTNELAGADALKE
ncbi:MAG: ABC transporter substrate-binding protein [Caldilineaceae bacterium]|nr:ABC transporter substrate-binding protein [Caldilineaceae bacterium]MBP8109046.1 ABC transporter substrate-binding protein [Caldilineaceae bacterium]MBP8122029.1 ABC transporter substrate-binding protein [Caldilineaceae bacterium]